LNINPKSPLVSELALMHTYCRPHGSYHESIFIRNYIANLPGADMDVFGNWHVVIGDAPVIWSSHTDTVHRTSGRQHVRLTGKGDLVLAKQSRKSDCLGADDTVGVFLMRQMIQVGIPGRYIFHYGEEAGCLGSAALAAENPGLLDKYIMAIAFDRMGTSDIITHQIGGRTASDEFAASLALQLNGDGLTYKACDQGIYTDTAQYADLVNECTNVSIGYYNGHCDKEYVDTRHVLRLLAALMKIDTEALVIGREPGQDDPTWPMAINDDDYLWDEIDNDMHAQWNRDDQRSAFLDPRWWEIQQLLRK
jgi:hypothetical protein